MLNSGRKYLRMFSIWYEAEHGVILRRKYLTCGHFRANVTWTRAKIPEFGSNWAKISELANRANYAVRVLGMFALCWESSENCAGNRRIIVLGILAELCWDPRRN